VGCPIGPGFKEVEHFCANEQRDQSAIECHRDLIFAEPGSIHQPDGSATAQQACQEPADQMRWISPELRMHRVSTPVRFGRNAPGDKRSASKTPGTPQSAT